MQNLEPEIIALLGWAKGCQAIALIDTEFDRHRAPRLAATTDPKAIAEIEAGFAAAREQVLANVIAFLRRGGAALH